MAPTIDRTQATDRAEALYRRELKRCVVAPSLHSGITRYLVYHIKPGDFLMAVLQNDLRLAVSRADEDSFATLRPLIQFLMSTPPSNAWGSADAVESWLAYSEVKV